MTFKLSVTTKVIPCGLNWTNMNQAFPNNSLFLLLRFSKKNMLKRGQLICLLITIIYQRKHACWVVITITPPRHASTPRPKWKQPWKPGWFEILPRQESARWFAYINVCKTWTLTTKTVLNYILWHMVFYFVHSMDLPFYMAVHNDKPISFFDTLFSQNYFLIFPLLRNTLPVNTKSSSNVLNCFYERLIDARNVRF